MQIKANLAHANKVTYPFLEFLAHTDPHDKRVKHTGLLDVLDEYNL